MNVQVVKTIDRQTKILNHLDQYFKSSQDPLIGFFTQNKGKTPVRAWEFVITPRKSIVKNRITAKKHEFDSLEALAEWAASIEIMGAYISYSETIKKVTND